MPTALRAQSGKLPSGQTGFEDVRIPGRSVVETNAADTSARSSDDNRDGTSSSASVAATSHVSIPRRRPDFNDIIYRKNRFDVSIEGGRLPINIPFVFDFLLGGGYNKTPLNYTLAPIIVSIHWQMSNVRGPWILRGNWDSSFSGTYTDIPRGPETRYFGYMMGIRRNFVRRNVRVAPFIEGRLGTGDVNAKGPYGAAYAQGQDYTFTLMLDSGMRYNLSPKYSIWAGAGYMHISNLYLSEPRYLNYGINVYGPMFGIEMRVGKHPRGSAY